MLRRFGFAVLLLSVIATGRAQTPTGAITGTITDSSGAVVAGATITLINAATNSQRTVVSNEAGIYSLPSLLPGVYSIKVELKGFKSEDPNNIDLPVGQVDRLDFTLRVG